MKINIICVLTAFLYFQSSHLEAIEDTNHGAEEEGFEYLLCADLPVVVTASKTEQSLERTTSVVSVITDSDIRNTGARTLWEVLKTVPGFFPTIQPAWPIVGARGFLSDGNDHILLLIDGHPHNSIIQNGFQQLANLPVLEKVKKIEIIRGPGSVLWGSDAVYGIINVITKDSVEGSTATLAYGNADGMFSANYMDSFRLSDDLKTFFSFSLWKADGWTVDDAAKPRGLTYYGGSEALDNAVHSPVEFQWGKFYWPPIMRQKNGFEVYTKFETRNSGKFTAGFSKSNFDYPWDAAWGQPETEMTQRESYLSYERHTEFNDRISLDSIFNLSQTLAYIDPSTRDFYEFNWGDVHTTLDYNQQSSHQQETSYSLEFTGNFKLSDFNSLKAGTKYNYTEIGPSTQTQVSSYNNRVVTGYTRPFYNPLDAIDKTIAFYAEDMQTFNEDKTSLFFGMRYDKNNYREDKAVILPRGGIIQSLSDSLTAKYVYNTGYYRPNLVYSKVNFVSPSAQAKKSEQIESHDVQLFWKQDKNYAAITLFYMNIDNFITYTERRDGLSVTIGYQNVGDNSTKGVELEGKFALTDKLALLGNCSYARAKLVGELTGTMANADNETLNYPHQTYNLGAEWLATEKSILNVYVNGFRDMPYLKQIGAYSYYGEEATANSAYLNLNYITRFIMKTPLEVALFMDNVLDNQDPVGLVATNGVYYPRGRNVGGRVTLVW